MNNDSPTTPIIPGLPVRGVYLVDPAVHPDIVCDSDVDNPMLALGSSITNPDIVPLLVNNVLYCYDLRTLKQWWDQQRDDRQILTDPMTRTVVPLDIVQEVDERYNALGEPGGGERLVTQRQNKHACAMGLSFSLVYVSQYDRTWGTIAAMRHMVRRMGDVDDEFIPDLSGLLLHTMQTLANVMMQDGDEEVHHRARDVRWCAEHYPRTMDEFNNALLHGDDSHDVAHRHRILRMHDLVVRYPMMEQIIEACHLGRVPYPPPHVMAVALAYALIYVSPRNDDEWTEWGTVEDLPDDFDVTTLATLRDVIQTPLTELLRHGERIGVSSRAVMMQWIRNINDQLPANWQQLQDVQSYIDANHIVYSEGQLNTIDELKELVRDTNWYTFVNDVLFRDLSLS